MLDKVIQLINKRVYVFSKRRGEIGGLPILWCPAHCVTLSVTIIPELNVAGDVKLKAWVRPPAFGHYHGKDFDNLILKRFARIIQSSMGFFEKLITVSITKPVVQASVDNLIRISSCSSSLYDRIKTYLSELEVVPRDTHRSNLRLSNLGIVRIQVRIPWLKLMVH